MRPQQVASHSFYPLIRYVITTTKRTKKPDTDRIVLTPKERPISYAAHADAHIYAYYATILAERYEELLKTSKLDSNVLAFRPLGKSNIDFAAQAFKEIRSRGECAAVALDIKGFFDNLDHGVLKKAWCHVLGADVLPDDHFALFSSLTRYSFVSRDAAYKALSIPLHNPQTGRRRLCRPKEFRSAVRAAGLIKTNLGGVGIPQGTPISSVLSNIYMFDVDHQIATLMKTMGGTYYRYCDDMLVIVPADKKNEVAGQLNMLIINLKLRLNESKTEIREFRYANNGRIKADKALQYLGFVFDGQNVRIRSASLARCTDRMKRGVRLAHATMKSRDKKRMNSETKRKHLFKRKLYQRYSYLGRRNFLSYAYRASNTMQSKAIRKQVKPLWRKLRGLIG